MAKTIVAAGRLRPRVQLACLEPTRTKQSFKDECDVRTIIKRVSEGSMLPLQRARGVGRYGDFSEVLDFKTALDQVNGAMDAFLELPARLRARFRNDPAELLAFMADPDNLDEAVKLGLVAAPDELLEAKPKPTPKPEPDPSLPAPAADESETETE